MRVSFLDGYASISWKVAPTPQDEEKVTLHVWGTPFFFEEKSKKTEPIIRMSLGSEYIAYPTKEIARRALEFALKKMGELSNKTDVDEIFNLYFWSYPGFTIKQLNFKYGQVKKTLGLGSGFLLVVEDIPKEKAKEAFAEIVERYYEELVRFERELVESAERMFKKEKKTEKSVGDLSVNQVQEKKEAEKKKGFMFLAREWLSKIFK